MPRDYQREYARRFERARARGFESPYVERYIRRLRSKVAEGETISQSIETIRNENRAARLRRELKKPPGEVPRRPKGWFTLPILVYRTKESGTPIANKRLDYQQHGGRLPISPDTGEAFERWLPEPPEDSEIIYDTFTDPQEADNYCVGDGGADALWWLWARQLD